MPNTVSTIAAILAAAAAAATVAKTVHDMVSAPGAEELSLEMPSFAAPAGGGSAVTIIQDLIQQQTSFLQDLLPAVVNPLAAKIAAETQVESATLQLWSAIITPMAESFGLLAQDARDVLFPGVSAAAGALFRIIEAILTGKELPAGSLLQVLREVLVIGRRVAGKEGAAWLGPLTSIITQILPRILSKQDRRLDELLLTDEDLPFEVRNAFALGPFAAAASLPALWKVVLWILPIIGQIVALEALQRLGQTFPQMQMAVAAAGVAAGEFMLDGMQTLHAPMQAVVERGSDLLFTRLDQELDQLAGVAPEDVMRTAPRLLAMSAGLGMSAHVLSTLAEKIAVFKQMGFPQLAAFLVDMAGFQGIARNTVGVQMETALRSPATRHARKRFRSELPDPGRFEQLYLERKISDEEFREYFRMQGWPEDLIEQHRLTVFREAPPRELAIVFEDAEVDEAWVLRMLQEQGYTDEDADLLMRGVKTRSQRAQRQALIGAVTDLFEDGLLSQEDLRAHLDTLHLRDDTMRLIIAAAANRRYRRELNDRRKLLLDGAALGGFSAEVLGAELAALGFDDRAIQHAQRVTQLRQMREIFEDERSEVKASIRRAQADRISAALDAYRRFRYNEDVLREILLGHGVRESEVDALVELARIRRTPLPKLAEELSPEAQSQRALQRLADQVLTLQKNEVIDEGTAITLLIGLGLDQETATLEAGLVAARLQRPRDEKAEAEAERAARELRQARVDAALTRFRAGRISETDLQGQLEAAGLERATATALVEREGIRRQTAVERELEALQRLEDQQSQRQLAEELRIREDAVLRAFRAGKLDEVGLFVNLVALGRSPEVADAIIARETAVRPPGPAQDET